MSKLNAFVGHSFNKDDEDAVRAILEYLDQIKKMNIGFTWEHAREAEPKELAQKVKELFEDKNLFIGICTRNERAIENKKLKAQIFSKNKLCAISEDFSWKTSDWIIQEIGIAFGRGMDVILLVEENLRSPGGFQGNLEYIEFNRQTPEKSFGRILEMIRALLPKAIPMQEAVSEMPKSSEKEKIKEDNEEWRHPKPEWERWNYEFVLMHMVMMEDNDGEKRIDDAYFQTEEGKKEDSKVSWSAIKEYTHIWLGKDGSLGKLEELAKANPENSDVQRYLAKAYQEFDEEEKAAESYLNAALKEADKTHELISMGEAAKAYAKSKKKTELNKLIKKIKEKSYLIDDGEIKLLKILRDISDIQNDKTSYLACAERLLDLTPDDNDSRFSLAYGHSQEDREALALFHYLKIPYLKRSSSAWNNTGVCYSSLGLYGKSIEAYRTAEEKEETLAMDNIARKYLDAGFLKEAQEQCNKAKKYDNYHKNIDDTTFRLKKKKEDEDKKSKEILDEVKPVHEFYVEYGHAATNINLTNLKGGWSSKQCPLSIEINNDRFTAYGTYEVGSIGIILSAMGGLPEEITKYEIFYEGEIKGFTVNGTVRISKLGEKKVPNSLMSTDKDSHQVLMIFAEDLSTIKVYQESATYDSQKFEVLNKIKELDNQ